VQLPAYGAYIQLRAALRQAIETLRNNKLRLVSLTAPGPRKGCVLLAYMLEPFQLLPGQRVSHGHTNHWESLEMAQAFLELGYDVDVINWDNYFFRPLNKSYAFAVDVRRNLERLTPLLNSDCVRIFHIDTAHILFHNAAESRRLLELQQRKGVTIMPRRWERPNLGIEHAHCCTILGGTFTQETYKYAGKQIYTLPMPSPFLYDWKEGADFGKIRRNFLWLGSGGLVHKGLDLVLDAFADMPDYQLTICGPIERETDFVQLYKRELYELPNVRVIGWIDVASDEFKKLAFESLGVVYTSCSEGGGGSVIACMHAGLIPVVNRESSVDLTPANGVMLLDSTVASIQHAVRNLAERSPEELEGMARQAWATARATHTRENYAQRYREVIRDIEKKYRKS
jgi:glycosyltransferase involved in cell wall biosynthesis